MKTPKYFLDTAHKYLRDITEVSETYIRYPVGDKSIDKDYLFEQRDKHEKQQHLISELFFKIKLLFSEFDKGELFIDRLGKRDISIRQHYIEFDRVRDYKKCLLLFIEHVNNFRA